MAQNVAPGEVGGGGSAATGSSVSLAAVVSGVNILTAEVAGILSSAYRRWYLTRGKLAHSTSKARVVKRVYTLDTSGVPDGGHFRLAIDGAVMQSTGSASNGAMTFDESAADISTALVAISDTNGDSDITVAGGALPTDVTITTSDAHQITLCDYITITLSGSPSASFTLSVGGQTATIAHTSTVAQTLAAVNGLSNGIKCAVTGAGALDSNVQTLIVPTGTVVSVVTQPTGGTATLGTAVNHLLTGGTDASLSLTAVDTIYRVEARAAYPTAITGIGASGLEKFVRCFDLSVYLESTNALVWRARIPLAQLEKVANWSSLTAAVIYP